MVQHKPRKRRGRPPKPASERKRRNLTFRTTDKLRGRLEASAGQSGRSVSEEIEQRLERSYDFEELADVGTYRLMQILALLKGLIERKTGASADTDKNTYIAWRSAVTQFLDRLSPDTDAFALRFHDHGAKGISDDEVKAMRLGIDEAEFAYHRLIDIVYGKEKKP